MKRFFLFVLLCVLLGGLAACAPTPAPPVVATQAPAQATKAPEAKPIKLRLASWQWDDPAYKPFWDGTTAAFTQKNPHITFEKFGFAIDTLWDKLNTEIVAGTPPDLIEVTGFNVFQYMDQGVLMPLDDCFKGTNIPDKVKDQKTYAVKGGKIYALNLSARTLELFVNQKLFDEAGVKVPTNLAEFKDAAKKLTNPAKEQYGIVMTNLPHSRLYEGVLVFIAGRGGHFSKNGKPALNSPEVIGGIKDFKEILDNKWMPAGVKDASAQYAWFNQGKAAMSIDGAWYWAVLEGQAPEVLKNTKIYPIPTDNHAATGGINNLIGIAAKSPNTQAACEYLKFIADPTWGQVWTKSSRTIYPYEGSVPADFLQANPWFSVFSQELPKAVPVAPPGLEVQYDAVQKIINTKLSDIFYNNKPVEQAMNEAQAEVEKLFPK